MIPEHTWLISLQGVVQGLGIRPRIKSLADNLNLNGWVRNSIVGVDLMISGSKPAFESFIKSLQHHHPGEITIQEQQFKTFAKFSIEESIGQTELNATVAPDINTCELCLSEWADSHNRRYAYPFISCAQCGPRFSITDKMPFDRKNTSMAEFSLCLMCKKEYENPKDRRYHAQTISCWECGPKLELIGPQGTIANNINAIKQAAQALVQNKLVAIKGIGGFHLAANACVDKAVLNARKLKHRPAKPFAIMVKDLNMAQEICDLSVKEKDILLSPKGMILIARYKKESKHVISQHVQPRLSRIGLMLPYTAMHHALMRFCPVPIIITSLNHENQPIIYCDRDVDDFLAQDLDLALTHNRKIVRPIDDSIVHCVNDKTYYIRRGRGGIPFRLSTPYIQDKSILALGGHLKNTVACTTNHFIELSSPIGDLTSLDNQHRQSLEIKRLTPSILSYIVCDQHPDYESSWQNFYSDVYPFQVDPERANHETSSMKSIKPIQHHHAHILSVMAEHQLEAPVLGVAWDGLGLGQDSTFWGGETFWVGKTRIDRITSCKSFQLIGGEAAVKAPQRVALSLLAETFGSDYRLLIPSSLRNQFSNQELELLNRMMLKNVQSPRTSSIGRLFDGVSALLGLCYINEFEGQAATYLEDLAWSAPDCQQSYRVSWSYEKLLVLDWRPMISKLIDDLHQNIHPKVIALKFHRWLLNALQAMVLFSPTACVVLSGGVFQNKWLLEHAQKQLDSLCSVYTNEKIPCHDGGLSVGQVYAQIRIKQVNDQKVQTCV